MFTLAEIGLIISLAFPLVISIYKETRFVIEKNLLVYGVSLITFALSFTAYTIPENLSILRILCWLFGIMGLIMILFYFKVIKNPIVMKSDNKLTLIYSWKNYGAFEFAFILPVVMKETPILISMGIHPIIDLGLSLLIIFWIASLCFLVYRNWIKNAL